MYHLELPPFFCPVEPAVHPNVDILEDRASSWIDTVEICDDEDGKARLIGTRSAEFYGRITPDGDVGRMQPAVNWCYWGFAFDDARCDDKSVNGGLGSFMAMAARLVRAIESPDPGSLAADPYVAALADIGADLRRFATATQVRRWARAHRSWLFGTAWQIGNTEADLLPNLDDYLVLRLDSCAGEPTTAMIEMVNGAEVPDREMDSPPVVAITEATRLVAALDNDVVSYRKEQLLHQADQNIINVLAQQERCSPQNALIHAAAVRDRIMSLVLRLHTRLSATASVELRAYLDALLQLIRGNIDWSLRVARYHDFPGADAGPVGVTDRPSDTSLDPLPVATLGWWWDHVA